MVVSFDKNEFSSFWMVVSFDKNPNQNEIGGKGGPRQNVRTVVND